MTRVSLLLPNRDNDRVLDLTLSRLAANTTYRDVELIVVDDGSQDGSRDILRRWRDSGRFPSFELIEKEGSGVTDALNLGLEAATGTHLVQLDADATIETPGWIERMLAFFARDERVGVVTAKVVMDNGVLHACGIDVVGPAGLLDRPAEPTDPVGHRRWHHRIDRRPEGSRPDVEDRAAEVDAGIGCCMMLRREDVVALGGWDGGYKPVWIDDVDLCVGIRSLGRKAFYVPDVRVVHHVHARSAPQRRTAAGVARNAAFRVGRALPFPARDPLEGRLGLDLSGAHTRVQRERLRHHYAYWRSKWGWDMLNPDMDAVLARWGDTEVCWRSDPERRRAGEAILAGR